MLALLVGVAAAFARRARGLAEKAASPTLDAPGQATPEEQAETDRRVRADWTPENIEEALANPRLPRPGS